MLSNRPHTLWVEKINLVNLEREGENEMRTVRGFDYCDGLKSALQKPLHMSLMFIKSQMHLHHIFAARVGCSEGKLAEEPLPYIFFFFFFLN